MKRMIRIELYRAFHGKELKIGLLLGALLALEHFIFRVIPSLDNVFDNYHPDIADSIVKNLLSGWMGGMINAEINIYQTIVVLLITIPYAGSFYKDRKIGILKNIAVREEKKTYLTAKSVAVFLSSGVSAVFPLLLNFLLTAAVLPVINYDWFQLPSPGALFISLAVENVVMYSFTYMITVFVFAGLIGGVALTISLYADNIFVVLTLPFFICIVSGRLLMYSDNEIIRGLAVQKFFYPPQSSPTTIISGIILFTILSICGYIYFIFRGEKKDVL